MRTTANDGGRSALARRARAGTARLTESVTGLAERGRRWAEAQDPSTRTGVGTHWVRRYREADGQLYAVLLAAYFFLTVLPVTVVQATYISGNTDAFAARIAGRLELTGPPATFLNSVLAGAGKDQLVAVIVAIANIAVFGLGFGRVLQLAHARIWGLDLAHVIADQARYLAVLLALMWLTCVWILQVRYTQGAPSWAGWVLDAVWLAVLVAYFVWAPRLLLHRRVGIRDLLPGAVITVAGLAILHVAASFVLRRWLVSYSDTYGGLGIVMAILFWFIAAATVMMFAAALSPAVAARRAAVRSAAAGSANGLPGSAR
jgi:membrane protein